MGELVELDVTTVEESVTVNVTEEGQVDIAVFAETGPAGPAGPNSVTSATTSDGTCDLSLDTLTVGISTASGVRAVAIGQSTASGALSFASGASTATDDYCFANGDGSTASGYAATASGTGAIASGYASTAFGNGTTASGYASTASGTLSTASGDFSIAIGYRAKAIHDGASVESDSQDADVESTTTDEKTFRFQNGYRFLGGAVTIDGTLNCDHIHGNIAGSVYAHVRAGEDLAKGDPVYISGSHGTGANLIAIVSKADASNAAKMPAVGVMDAAVSNNANGHMVITGTISDLDTNAYAVNSVLYVASGGGFTSTPPANNSQPVAIVERSNTNNGAVIVKVNGLASSGGNGASDANKLVRYSSTGTLPIASIGGLGSNVATFLATPTSANLAAAVTDETGSGSLVFAELPTLNSPTLNNIPEATLAAIATLTGQTGAPPVVLFDDFYGSGNTTVGMWTWADGTTGTAGTGSTDAGNTANGSSQYAGMCRINTAAVSGNGRTRFLNIGSSGKMIGTQWRACFAIPDITNVRITIGGQGGGGAYELRYDSSANSGQWVLAIAVNSVYTIYTFTTATALAGDFQSGKRYRMSLTRTSTTLCTLVLEIADYNLANWSDVFRGTITHLAHFENLQAWQPMFTVTALEAVIKRLCVDWISIYNPNILR